jgi:hypothetical protein
MAIIDGFSILTQDINVTFSNAAVGPITGLTFGIDAMKDMKNAYTILGRFRVWQESPSATDIITKQYFTSPDDYDAYAIGFSVRWDSPTAAAAGVQVRVQGALTDLESDLPLPTHLFLTEPITNLEGGLELHWQGVSAALVNADRYVTYDVDSNRPANTLLKGSKYEVITTVNSPTDGKLMVETFMLVKNALRRN